ncbi:hypothetical protein BS47DRAFT_1362262 [Hydnum rufescens UP504]|uniref:FAD-binding domain-containing protein n=1 Tax=Hydnum rufescens UP504 TaxID=1448309 RepID=A0A9P6AX96_9AGAM|nr:hypothetical protein BS47DRAFT_1362262 [Hydnum rufescens UP504]
MSLGGPGFRPFHPPACGASAKTLLLFLSGLQQSKILQNCWRVSARHQLLRAHGTALIVYEEEYRSVVSLKTQGGLVAALVLRKNVIPVRLIEEALDYQIGVRGNGIQVTAMDLPGSLEEILRFHLSRLCVTVKLGTELVDFTQDAHKVTTNLLKHDKRGFSENEALEVDWVIGADGAQGTTPKRLGINFCGETVEKQVFPVAGVDMEGPNREFLALSFPYESIGPPMKVPPPGGILSNFGPANMWCNWMRMEGLRGQSANSGY